MDGKEIARGGSIVMMRASNNREFQANLRSARLEKLKRKFLFLSMCVCICNDVIICTSCLHSSNLQTGKQIYLVVGTLGPGGRVEASVICNGGTDPSSSMADERLQYIGHPISQ